MCDRSQTTWEKTSHDGDTGAGEARILVAKDEAALSRLASVRSAATTITYSEVKTEDLPKKAAGEVQKRLSGRVALIPDFDPKGQVTVKALIDRMKIAVGTDIPTSENALKAALDPVARFDERACRADAEIRPRSRPACFSR